MSALSLELLFLQFLHGRQSDTNLIMSLPCQDPGGIFHFTILCGCSPCLSSVSPSWILPHLLPTRPLPCPEVPTLLNSFQPLEHATFSLSLCPCYINSFKNCIHRTWPCCQTLEDIKLIGRGGELGGLRKKSMRKKTVSCQVSNWMAVESLKRRLWKEI